MDVNRSGYYKWVSRKSKPSQKQIQREKDVAIIKEIHRKHPSHGYRWIRAYAVKHYSVKWSNYHVHLCCKYAGIISSGKHYQYVKPGDERIKYKNLINASWRYLSRPLEVVISDMTAFYVKGKYYELTFYFDAYTKEILSFRLSDRRGDTSTYFDGLKDVLNIIKKEELTEPTVLHTDQGSVFSSISYNELTKNYNIKRSMSRAGTPTDNPVDESLNGWIKEELFLDFNLGKTNDVNRLIKEYVHYYNNERFSYALKYKTPAEFKSQLGIH